MAVNVPRRAFAAPPWDVCTATAVDVDTATALGSATATALVATAADPDPAKLIEERRRP